MSEPGGTGALPPDARIYVAGHRGLVGGAIVRRLQAAGYRDLVLRTRAELDLRDARAVDAFLAAERPTHVFLAAAHVGGIHANDTYPADFIRDNLQIQTALVDGAWRAGVRKLLFLGSSCIYPREAPQPMPEDCLLTGPLEATNQWYAIAKIAGIKMCEAYRRQHGFDAISVMPTNLYGPGDNFHPANSHVLPALIRRFHEAKVAGAPEVVVWGTGSPMREFLHVDDMAAASLFVLDLDRETYQANTEPMLSHINVGTGTDVSIRELAEMIAGVTGFQGRIAFDSNKPDGTPRKLLDVSRLARMGWSARIGLREGLASTYEWFLTHAADMRQ